MTNDNSKTVETLKGQLLDVESELKKQRTGFATIKENFRSVENDNKLKIRELEELKRRLIKTLEESEESYKLLQDAVRYPHSHTPSTR
jgi:formiminotetrahydrofolate cyclodeaminase